MTQFYPYHPPHPPSSVAEKLLPSLPRKEPLDHTRKSAFSSLLRFFSFFHFVCPSLHLSTVNRWKREQSPRQLRCKFRQTNPIKSWPALPGASGEHFIARDCNAQSKTASSIHPTIFTRFDFCRHGWLNLHTLPPTQAYTPPPCPPPLSERPAIYLTSC